MFSAVRDRWQVLVCEIDAESPSPNAVIVPLPAAAGPGAVEKIDPAEFALGWDGRRRFFDDLQGYFVAPPIGRPGGGQAYQPSPASADAASVGLPAHPPGRSYPSSETPSDAVELFGSPASLAGLEQALTPHQALHDLLAQRYPGDVLALCRLPAGFTRAFVAVRYEPRDGTRVFFPLLQATDGRSAPSRAFYEHDLFGQGVVLDERMLSFDQRAKAAGFKPLVTPPPPPFPRFVQVDAPIDLASRRGLLPNEDLRVPVTPE
jgi:hypothetical protein